jgi:hypothetical protein
MTTSEPLPIPDAPFRGIESFRFIDQQIFAERDDEIWDLQSNVTRYRAVLLYGESGTGKSSLINAGLIPSAMRKNLVADRIRLQPTLGQELIIERISINSDGRPPYLPSTFVSDEATARVVLSLAEFSARLDALNKSLSIRSPELAADQFNFTPSSRPLLIFDQFEELVTLFEPSNTAVSDRTSSTGDPSSLSDQSDIDDALRARTAALAKMQKVQQGIIDLLVRLVQDETLKLKLLFVFREDYLAKLNILFRRVPDLLDQYLRLLPPNPEVVTKIIRAPFERLPGVFVNRKPDGIGTEISQSLAESITKKFIERSGGGALNLSELEIVCRRLWESKNPDSLFAQKQIAGVLEDYFSEKLAAFPTELQEPAVALLGLMITSANTRNIISEADLFSRVQKEEEIEPDKATKARDLLLGTRLVWRELRNGVYFFTIASDYLAKWIAAKKTERTAERERRKLAQQAELIKRGQQDESGGTRMGGNVTNKGVGFDERAFIRRVQSADADELSELVARPSPDEEKALRVYFTDKRYQQLHSLALERKSGRTANGNVVIIPGLMGSELSVFTSASGADAGELIWLNFMHILQGRFSWLKLNDDGTSGEYDVRPTGVMKRQYGELILSLSRNWNVRTFAFDWRKDLHLAAVELESQIERWFGGEPVHIVAHEMGGLVARAFIAKYPERWKTMWDGKSGVPGRRGGRLIMLGTPNHGTYTTLHLILGLHPIVKQLSGVDIRHGHADVRQIFNSFVGPYQTLPSPLALPTAEGFYESDFYRDLKVPQNRLDAAYKFHHFLNGVVDPDRMIYIGGDNQRTFCGIKNYNLIGSLESYEVTTEGDGLVPHNFCALQGAQGLYVPAYCIEETNANLPVNPKVMEALNKLLELGRTSELKLLGRTSKKLSPSDQKVALKQLTDDRNRLEQHLTQLSQQVMSLATDPSQATTINAEEVKLEELITRGQVSESTTASLTTAAVPEFETLRIEVGLVYGQIGSIEYGKIRSSLGDPVDSIAVGHYIGVLPQGPELSLDRVISSGQSRNSKSAQEISRQNLLLTQYTQWGIIHGELGRPFFLNDPRITRSNTSLAKQGRLIAIAGMGQPGRFGAPELTVLSRNLCWSLGRIERRHLETVLIGAGDGNLNVHDAVTAWMRGIRLALIRAPNDRQRLRRITFVESDPHRITRIQDVILDQVSNSSEEPMGLSISYKMLNRSTLQRIEADARKAERLEVQRRRRPPTRKPKPSIRDAKIPPIRVSVSLQSNIYRIGAISENASLPERELTIDPALIEVARSELIESQVPTDQLERGRFLRALLFTRELTDALASDAPLIFTLDGNAARIPWEMIANPETVSSSGNAESPSADFVHSDKYLGTTRGLTRQLPFMSSMLPEPPPPPRRVLRVLVVADPAEDARLPGAEAEGLAVANVFESFNAVHGAKSKNRVEVVKLLGPLEATRTTLLRELMLRNYDVLHFAGHCIYDELDPAASGWLFSRGERLSPRELNRIDRIPRFIFSNATASTVKQAADKVVSFAESFLARGVTNFIYPAWLVDDVSARRFAQTLYAALLGLKPKPLDNGYDAVEPLPLSMAVYEARLEAGVSGSVGGSSWGAYQHYGGREFRFFAENP